jgi:hypothetical protein
MVAALSILSFVPVQVQAKNKEVLTAEQKEAQSAKANVLLTRLHEIDAMDKSEMSATEKRQLRKEVRTIKGDLKELGDGVYLSVGAIIIIILLLILLL